MKHLLLSSLALACLFLFSCQRDTPITASEDFSEAEFIDENLAEGSFLECATSQNCGNCVFYAACRMGQGFPGGGLWTLEDKCGFINSNTPQVGYVAVIDAYGTIGHVAYVSYVSYDGQYIYLQEGGWNGGCNYRSVSVNDASIVGYYNPSQPKGNQSCGSW